MRLKNKLFLAFFLFAFLPVAAVSYFGIELMIESRERVIAPGISLALATADSLAEMSVQTVGFRCKADMLACESCSTADDYIRRGFDFAAVLADGVMSFAGDLDSTSRTALASLLSADSSSDTTGWIRLNGKSCAFTLRRAGPSAAVAGRLLPEDMLDARDRLGTDVRQFAQLKLLRVSDRNFIRLIWGLSNALYLLIILYITRMTASSLTGPLARLERLVDTVGPGRWDVHLDYRGNDEVGSLVTGFNKMSSRLSETTERLIEAERTAAWESTARVISHGIKNVLAPVKLALARIAEDQKGAQSESTSPIETIRTELQVLENTARDFSLYGRTVGSTREPFDLNLVVRSAARMCESQRSRKQIDIRLPDGSALAHGDENMAREAFINLIKNACEATDEGQTVSITVSTEPSGLEVRIHNSGAPINASVRDRIFEPYVTTKPGGTGLGLAIVKKAIESSGGSISFETGNNGTTFIVKLNRADEQQSN